MLVEARRLLPLWAAFLVTLLVARIFVLLPPFEAFQALIFIWCVEALADRIPLPASALAAIGGVLAGAAVLGKVSVGDLRGRDGGRHRRRDQPPPVGTAGRRVRGRDAGQRAGVLARHRPAARGPRRLRARHLRGHLGLQLRDGRRFRREAPVALPRAAGRGRDRDLDRLAEQPRLAAPATDRPGDPRRHLRLRAVEARGRPRARDLRLCDGRRGDVPVRDRGRPSNVAGVDPRDRRSRSPGRRRWNPRPTSTSSARRVRSSTRSGTRSSPTGWSGRPSRPGRGSATGTSSIRPPWPRSASETVHVDPVMASAAYAYPDLDWKPLPIFQSYTAYTSALDGLNADLLRSADAPQRILRNVQPANHTDRLREWIDRPFVDGEFLPVSVDGRFRWFESPAAMLETFCRYDEISVTERWQVLARTGRSCGATRVPGHGHGPGRGAGHDPGRDPAGSVRHGQDRRVGAVPASGASVTALQGARLVRQARRHPPPPDPGERRRRAAGGRATVRRRDWSVRVRGPDRDDDRDPGRGRQGSRRAVDLHVRERAVPGLVTDGIRTPIPAPAAPG